MKTEWEIIKEIVGTTGREVLIHRMSEYDRSLYAIVRTYNGGRQFPADVSGLTRALVDARAK